MSANAVRFAIRDAVQNTFALYRREGLGACQDHDYLPDAQAAFADVFGEGVPVGARRGRGAPHPTGAAVTADLSAIAATTLRRLASEMRAAAAIGAQRPAALTGDHDRACALLAEARREAMADLERLRDSLPPGSTERLRAGWQIGTLDGIDSAGRAADCDAWATAWEASP